MREFLITHSETFFIIIGIIVAFIVIRTISYWRDTKYEVIFQWYLVIIGLIGAAHTGEVIGKWFLK